TGLSIQFRDTPDSGARRGHGPSPPSSTSTSASRPTTTPRPHPHPQPRSSARKARTLPASSSTSAAATYSRQKAAAYADLLVAHCPRLARLVLITRTWGVPCIPPSVMQCGHIRNEWAEAGGAGAGRLCALRGAAPCGSRRAAGAGAGRAAAGCAKAESDDGRRVGASPGRREGGKALEALRADCAAVPAPLLARCRVEDADGGTW
ncbi:hypothetical protein EVG20_g11243, partial [Dentipellis fragilis]